MLNIAIVEDEEEAYRKLVEFTDRYSQESGETFHISYFASGEAFLKSSYQDIDVVFMDIELPGMNGMDTAAEMRKKNDSIILIFVTNLAKYAINGYRVNAMDYFLKPIFYPDFKMRMLRVSEIKQNSVPGKLIVTGQSETDRFNINDIEYIESSSHKIIIHACGLAHTWTRPSVMIVTSKEEKRIKNANLNDFEINLSPLGFNRCNSGYLVNLRHCSAINGFDLTVGNHVIQISRSRKKEFVDAFLKSKG